MSSVTTMASNPAFSARSTKLVQSSRSFGQYSWYHRGTSPIASATASIDRDDAVDSTIGTPSDAAPSAVATSASGCTIDCTPTGASSTGAGSARPNRSVVRSRVSTPRSIRGTIRHRRNASPFSRTVSSEPAPPAT